MIEFLSLFVGLVIGVHKVDVTVSGSVARVEFRLAAPYGVLLGMLTAPPFEVDLVVPETARLLAEDLGVEVMEVTFEEEVQLRHELTLEGTDIATPLKGSRVFPPVVGDMIAIGEESGSIDHMLSKVADFYEEDVDNAVDNMSSLLEPIIMAILGVLVGGLVIAMYLPIFKMAAVI